MNEGTQASVRQLWMQHGRSATESVRTSFWLARAMLFDVMLDENPRAQLARLAREIERLRQDAGFWQRSGKPETARELRALVVLLEGTVERIERRLLRARRLGVPTLFDP